LPVTIVLGVFFLGLFGLTYPYDTYAVVNPRYLLPVSTPMSACLGLMLARMESGSWKAMIVRSSLFVAIALVAALVVYERWGR
jgi:hypothetical protein